MAAITDVNYLLADSPKEELQENLFASVRVCNCTERVYRLKEICFGVHVSINKHAPC